jgi:hypothetical protein
MQPQPTHLPPSGESVDGGLQDRFARPIHPEPARTPTSARPSQSEAGRTRGVVPAPIVCAASQHRLSRPLYTRPIAQPSELKK